MKLTAALLAILLVALVYVTLPAPAHAPHRELNSVRKMAEFLESQPAALIPESTVARSPSRRTAAENPMAGRNGAGVANPGGPKDGPDHALAARAARARTDEIEQRLEVRYPRSESGALLRRYVALSLSGVDTDYQPELSRMRLLNDIMKDAPHAAAELQGVMATLPRDQGDAEATALLTAASYLAGNEVAKVTVESVMTTEMGRRGGNLSEEQEEARLNHLIDHYTSLVTDPQKREQFIRGGLNVQEHPRSRQLLLEALSKQNPAD